MRFLLLVCVFLTSCNLGESEKQLIEGGVLYLSHEDEWGLRTNDGREYRLLKLPYEFQLDGLRIKAEVKSLKERDVTTSGRSLSVPLDLVRVQPVNDIVLEWDRFFLKEVAQGGSPIPKIEEFRRQSGIPVPFWPGDKAESDPSVVAIWGYHPCGSISTAFVKRIPTSDNGKIHPDLVFELDEKDRILRRWWIPGNEIVYAIQGEELLVRYELTPILRYQAWQPGTPMTVLLAVRSTGEFRVVPRQDGLSMPKHVRVPQLREFKESAYAGLWIHYDLMTKKPRRLAYQGPCT